MKKFVDPPQTIKDELSETLDQRYPEFKEQNKNINRSISYSGGSSPISDYKATVKYYSENGASTAVFEYEKNHWYCSRDWND